jgi:hypothetical protein
MLNKTSPTITNTTSLFTGAIFIAFIFLFPLVGILVACIGFCDPDTCWHLALGKWIFTHHGLPYKDPFSSNIFRSVFVADNLPLMQHEWLSELVFYIIFATLGLTGLLVFTALASIYSFVIMPAFIMLRNGVPRIISIALIVLGLGASSFRLWVRPEEFSFIFMSTLIVINDVCQTTKRRSIASLCHLIIFLIMFLWANFHGLFFVGLAYLVGYCLLAFLEFVFTKKTSVNVIRSAIAVIVALLGTLNTPWHLKFWQSIYKLTASPANYGIRENGAMRLNDVIHPTFIPLCFVLILVWGILVQQIFRKKDAFKTMLLPLGLSFAATTVIIAYHRLTPLAMLVLFAAISKAFQIGKNEGLANKFLQISEKYFERYHLPDGKVSLLLGVFVSALVCFLTTAYFVQPCLPSPSRLFHPPFAAMQYLEQHQPKGRLINDSKFGSMMTWDMNKPPDIFIDGRFGVEREVFYDYNKIRFCKGDWQELLDKYKIDWLFFPTKTPIVGELSKTPTWKVEYMDDDAAILSRPHIDIGREKRL